MSETHSCTVQKDDDSHGTDKYKKLKEDIEQFGCVMESVIRKKKKALGAPKTEETSAPCVGGDGRLVEVRATAWKLFAGGILFTGKQTEELSEALEELHAFNLEKRVDNFVRVELEEAFAKHTSVHLCSNDPIDTIVSFLGFVKQIDLSNWHLEHCSCVRIPIDLSDATLRGTNFRNAHLRNVDFSRADLTNANFHRADLCKVKFDDAILTNVDFTKATFDATDLSTAKDMSGAMVDERMDNRQKDALSTLAHVVYECQRTAFNDADYYDALFD